MALKPYYHPISARSPMRGDSAKENMFARIFSDPILCLEVKTLSLGFPGGHIFSHTMNESFDDAIALGKKIGAQLTFCQNHMIFGVEGIPSIHMAVRSSASAQCGKWRIPA